MVRIPQKYSCNRPRDIRGQKNGRRRVTSSCFSFNTRPPTRKLFLQLKQPISVLEMNGNEWLEAIECSCEKAWLNSAVWRRPDKASINVFAQYMSSAIIYFYFTFGKAILRRDVSRCNCPICSPLILHITRSCTSQHRNTTRGAFLGCLSWMRCNKLSFRWL